MPSHRVRILHLSDLHERGSREAEVWRRRRVLGQAWLDNLKAILEDGPIDLVCFTGDAADWGKAEEFERTTDFFEAILKETGLSWDRFFAVPGNHDIDRGIEGNLWKKARPLLLSHSRLDAARWMAGQATSRELSRIEPARLLARQQSYRDWLRTIGRADLLPDPSLHPHLGYRQTLRLFGLPFDFHVIGLDSAWLCGSPSEAGQLLLTQDQIGRLCHGPDGDPLPGFRLLLVHHPLDDLADAAEARRLLGDSVDLLLRGHLHEPEISEWADPDRRLRQIAAGCLYEGHQADQYPNACALVEIALDGEGRPLRYDLRFRGWSPRGFWFDDNSLYNWSRGGRAVWELPPTESRGQEVFIGREAELQRLHDLLLPKTPATQPVSVCAIQGISGVGKSYLADRFASENQAAFPGGYLRLVLDPEKQAEPDALRQELKDSLHLAGTGPELLATLRERLRFPRTLLHVENVDSPAAERGVAQLLRDLQDCAVIITGRVHYLGWEEGWAQVPLQPFGETLGLEQLWTELKRKPSTLREEQEHRELVAALGYLPLAIHLAAGYLRSKGSDPDILRKLRTQGVQNEPFPRDGETSAQTLTASFQFSLTILSQQLGEASGRLMPGFRALGHAPPTGFGRRLGTVLAGLSDKDFENLTTQAAKLSLLLPLPREERPDGAWRMHPLLSEFLRQSTNPAEPLQRILDRFDGEERMIGRKQASQVFISYAREDESTARRLRADLLSQDIGTWFDREDILPGQDWDAAIRDAIKSCSHFLALISEKSINKRGFVQSELRLGLTVLDDIPPGEVYLIPVRVHDVHPLHERLRALQWVDLWPSYEQALERIVFAITGKKPFPERNLFLRIIEYIDSGRTLQDGSEASVKELTKRLLFYIAREIFLFPFSSYQRFVDWLRLEGYKIPHDLTFQKPQLYDIALTKVERLNRDQIDAKHVESRHLFSTKLPLRINDA